MLLQGLLVCIFPCCIFHSPSYIQGVHELLDKLERCALTKPIPRAPGQLALKSLASFLYNELITGCKAGIRDPPDERHLGSDKK